MQRYVKIPVAQEYGRQTVLLIPVEDMDLINTLMERATLAKVDPYSFDNITYYAVPGLAFEVVQARGIMSAEEWEAAVAEKRQQSNPA